MQIPSNVLLKEATHHVASARNYGESVWTSGPWWVSDLQALHPAKQTPVRQIKPDTATYMDNKFL